MKVGDDDLAAPVSDLYRSFNWSNELVWALRLPTIEVSMDDIAWQLRAPLWSTVPGKRLFDLCPATVIENPGGHR